MFGKIKELIIVLNNLILNSILSHSLGQKPKKKKNLISTLAVSTRFLETSERSQSKEVGLLIAIGGSIPLLCLEGIPNLPGTPQDEAGLTRKFER